MTLSLWRTETIEGCLTPLSLARTKLQVKDYQSTGAYPIIDQGQQLISGWTDEPDGVVSAPLPLVVFGDHTRIFKYVDFPFVRGADGTQILRPRSDIQVLFFYYACRAVDLPSRGYNRHFTALKECTIRLPPKDEQIAIGKSLQHVERHLHLQRLQLETVESLKVAAMRTLFSTGLRSEDQKETEIGLVPKSWETPRLQEVADIISTRMSYATLLAMTEDSSAEEGVKVLGIKVADMNRLGAEMIINEAALERALNKKIVEHYCAPPNTIVFPKNGAAVATNKKRKVSHWSAFDPNVMGLRSHPGLSQEFLFHWIQGFDLASIVSPGPVPHFNKSDLARVRVPRPARADEQDEIVAILDAIDRKIDLHRRKRGVLEDLFKALLHKLTTGEMRVDQLDLSALPPAAPQEAAA